MKEPLKAMFYGSSGSGKTVLCATALDDPRTNPVIWIDFENRTSSVASKIRLISVKEIKEPATDKLNVVRCKSVKDLQEVYDALYNLGDKRPYKSIVMDSASEINAMFLSRVRAGGGPEETPLNLEKLSVIAEERKLYGPTQRMIGDMLRGFRNMETMHIFITALPTTKEDKITSVEEKTMPMLTGQLREIIPSMMDLVGFLEIRPPTTRVLRVQPNGRLLAKDAVEGSSLGDQLVNPTIKELLDKLHYA